jgi:general secretion pathway protein J
MKSPTSKHAMDQNGFTLLEILIAIFILATVLSTVFASYTGTFRIVGETESQAEMYYMARVAFERILEDLESVVYHQGESESSEEQDEEYKFTGADKEIEGASADTLSFTSRAHLVFGEQDQPWGTAKISYYVEEDEGEEGLVLYRSDKPQLQEAPEEGGGGLPLSNRLASVDFKYYDSEGDEHDSWEEGIPRIVSISLEFADPAAPEARLKFATSVALPIHGAGEQEKK